MKSQVLIALMCFAVGVPAYAQYSTIWPTQPTNPIATDIPAGIQTLRISGVNDFLYTYDVNTTEIATPIVPGPAASEAVSTSFQGQNLEAFFSNLSDDCNIATAQNSLNSAYNALQALLPTDASTSVSLQNSEDSWNKTVESPYEAMQNSLQTLNANENCTETVKNFVSLIAYQKLEEANKNIHSQHMIESSFRASACKTEVIQIVEKYNGIPTGKSITVKLDVECDEVTVGGGVLLTEIQNRTYTSSPEPGQTGQFLSVGGNGRFHPIIAVGLLSFNLPVPPLGNKASTALGDLRLGIATGPTIQTGTSNTSSFGWFVGGSLSFLHRLYISPGMHFGEFADFPLGFGPSQSIPAGFGQLVPRTRWTGRFAIAITIKGWDASKSLKGGENTPATK